MNSNQSKKESFHKESILKAYFGIILNEIRYTLDLGRILCWCLLLDVNTFDVNNILLLSFHIYCVVVFDDSFGSYLMMND